jgi:phospho-N-acetylmuramoyl-pentapeptide-transferase
MKKQGTATMGGIAIMFSAFIGWLAGHLRGGIALSDQAMIMWAICGVLSIIGFLDDFLKVRRSHNRGIFWKKKGYITFGLVVIMMSWLLMGTGVSETLSFTRFDLPGWQLSPILWVLWTSIMVWATTNAVNVTDGLDGLAAGSALFGFLAFTVIAYWAFRFVSPC